MAYLFFFVPIFCIIYVYLVSCLYVILAKASNNYADEDFFFDESVAFHFVIDILL